MYIDSNNTLVNMYCLYIPLIPGGGTGGPRGIPGGGMPGGGIPGGGIPRPAMGGIPGGGRRPTKRN